MEKLTIGEIYLDILSSEVIDFNHLLRNIRLTDEAIDESACKLHWSFDMCAGLKCAEWVFENHAGKIDWRALSCNDKIKFSPEFIRKYGDKFNEGNFAFLKTKEAYEYCMDEAYNTWKWTKRKLNRQIV